MSLKHIAFLLSFCALFLGACGESSAADLTPTIPPELILTAMQDISSSETQAALNATPTATEEIPPTPEDTATPGDTATPEPDPTGVKGDGVFMVGFDIALGEWRSEDGAGLSCYWVRRKYDGVILGSYFGQQGTTMRIEDVDYEVEMEGCGDWTYVGP
ncbi:MAG: hypothetical protein DWQ07_04815 [Chloroflexi bacterium]|nr:MAG: hypothetical protein DWQ07_04815 [Chloroflexota bacterium]MBL1194753.1 hypothetical protein [Chloroflexota bacterium]NOH12045.1 hypothetical protein [Chloroflexota bacterium]